MVLAVVTGQGVNKRFEIYAQYQDLSTIDNTINWVDCRYKVD